jgi:hypothetical protein
MIVALMLSLSAPIDLLNLNGRILKQIWQASAPSLTRAATPMISTVASLLGFAQQSVICLKWKAPFI